MSVVLAHAVYLPAAQCFAIAPAVHRMRRSGDPAAAALDYNADSGSVVLTANRSYRWLFRCSLDPITMLLLSRCCSGWQALQVWRRQLTDFL